MILKNGLLTVIFLAAALHSLVWVWLVLWPKFDPKLAGRRTNDTILEILSVRLSTFYEDLWSFLRTFKLPSPLAKNLGFRNVRWHLKLKLKLINGTYEDSTTSQIFVRGALVGCKTAVLTFSDLRTVTVKDVTELLAARRLINPTQTDRYSLGYGGWCRTARLLPAVKLFDIGVRSNSTLVLSWTVRGFGIEKSHGAAQSTAQSIAGTSARTNSNLAYVLIPKAPYKMKHLRTLSSPEPNAPTPAQTTSTISIGKRTRNDGPEHSLDMPVPKKPRKNVLRILKTGEASRQKRKEAAPDSDSSYDSRKGLVKRSRVVKKRKFKILEYTSGDSSDANLSAESAQKEKRVHDKKLSNKRNLQLWALQEDVSYEALKTLRELCSIPSYEGLQHQLAPCSADQNQYSLIYGPHRITCRHDEEPPTNSLVYGGCCVLEVMGMYWSPLLRCIVHPGKHKILVWDELRAEIVRQHAEQCSSLPLSQEALFDHITRSFGMEEETVDTIYSRLHSVTVRHSIPGLAEPSLYRQCPYCHQWYTKRKDGRGKELHACSTLLGSQHVRATFSVNLLSSERDDLRIQVLVPQHRELIKQQSSTSTAKTAISISPGNLTTDSQLVKAWMDPTFQNVKGKNAPKLDKVTASNAYQFIAHGHTFRCLHSEQPPLTHQTLYTGCAVLSFFQLYACPLLKAVVNPSKEVLLCGENLLNIFKSRQHGQSNEVLLAHVKNVFSLLEEPEHVALKLDQPLLGLPAPRKVFLCQAPGCHDIFAPQTASKRHHYQRSPGCSSYPLIKSYAITLWPHGSKRFRALMTQNWIDKLPKLVRTAVHTYDVPPHFEDSGFLDHLKGWKIGSNSRILSTIAQLPSQTDDSWTRWSEGSLSSKLDRCLLQIHYLLGRYLTDSEVRLENSHVGIRRAISILHRDPDKASIKFGLIFSSTLAGYRSFLTKMFVIILRFFLVNNGTKDKDHPEDMQRCLKLRDELRGIKLRFTPKQIQLVQDFVSEVSNSSGEVSSQIILDFIHRFLVALFNQTYNAKHKVDCILEQVVLILSFTSDRKWRSAKLAVVNLSAIFRVARATFVNAAFMGSMKTGYKSLATLESLRPEETLDEEEEETEEEIEAQIKFQSEEQPASNADTEVCNSGDFNIGDEIETASKDDRPILKFFEKHSAFIDLNNPLFLCGRLHALRTSAVQVASREPSAARYIWSEDFGTLTFTWAFIRQREINIAELHLKIFKDVQEGLLKTFEQLFPTDFLTEHLDLSFLSGRGSLVDHVHCNSIFTIAENKKIFHPLVSKLMTKIFNRLATSQDSIKSLFDRSQAFLQAFLSVLFMTTGVPPHSWQAAQFRYADTPQLARNLMLVDGGRVIFTNAKAGVQSATTDRSLWLLPPQLSRVLLIYLGIVRPIEIALGAAEHYKLSDIDKEAMQSYIFCNPLRKKSPVWSADNVDGFLKASGLKMEAYALRLLFSEIIRVKHKVFLDDIDKPSVLDAQAQHTRATGRRHYAVAKLQHATGVQYSEYERQLLVCQAQHASCFLVKPPTLFTDKPTTIWDTVLSHQNYALLIARQLIDRKYNLATFSSDQVAVISRTLYRTTPFFFKENKNPAEKPTFCDEHLRKLVIELYIGPDGLANWSLAEVDHEEIENLTASAATLMLAAIAEWFSGSIVPYKGVVSLATSSWRSVFAAFKLDLGVIRTNHPILWEEYISWTQTKEHIRRATVCGEIEEEDFPLPCL